MATLLGSEFAPAPKVKPRRGLNGWIAFCALLPLIFLAFPVVADESSPSQPAAPALPEQLPDWLTQVAPYYGIVILLGVIVGLAEISSTFPNYPREALRTRWAKLLILINALAATLAFWLARTYASTANLALLAIGVGIGFQALIRTRFTLAKQIGGSGNDIELNLGWLYDQFQHLCKTQIDLELMQGRRTSVTQLLERYPSLTELHGIAAYTVTARTTLSQDEQRVRLDALEKLLDPKVPADLARASIALRILENGGQAYVELLLHQSATSVPGTVTPENLIKQMVDKYSLSELVALTKRLTSSPELHNWVEQAAQPTPDAPETSQKIAIAQRLMNEVGVEAVRQEMEKHS